MADSFTPEGQSTVDTSTETPFDQSVKQQTFPQILIGAVEAHFVARHSKAVANLNNYLQNTAAIGEHPDIVAECVQLFEELSAAEGALEGIRKTLS